MQRFVLAMLALNGRHYMGHLRSTLEDNGQCLPKPDLIPEHAKETWIQL